MKKSIKMILILLTFCMATALFVSCDNKQEDDIDDAQNNEQNVYEDDKFVYQVENDRVIIYAYKGKDENLKIPSEYNGKPVTKIDESASENCDFIKSVEIPDSVTSIGMFAFHGCTSLESVKLSNALTQLNESLFADCESLTSIEIPNGVVSIRDGAFSGCKKLESVNIPDGVTYIGYSAFVQCYALKSIELPDGVTEIGDSAFAYCKSLESIKIPKNVKNIGYGAFEGCELIKEVVIPKATTSLWNNAFSGCSALENIYCEAAEKPEYWDDGWNEGCPAKIHWGDSWHYADGVPTIK